MDLAVDTTLDPRLQEAAERVVAGWLRREGARRHVGQVALVALAPDGAVLSLVGGKDYGQSQFDRAIQAHRQPGSLFKIFVYLAAFNAGYTPDSVVVDQPVSIGDWEPRNFEPGDQGPVTLRTAFAQSINTVSVERPRRSASSASSTLQTASGSTPSCPRFRAWRWAQQR